jgi:bacterioferritin (cytochrome b1)
MDSKAIEDLNFLLKDELAAMEAYKKVLAKMDGDGKSIILKEVLQSHQDRANKLKSAIVKFGGEAVCDIGMGGKIAKLVIEGAGVISVEAMVAALTEDEGGWSSAYEWRLVSMHGDHRQLVKDDLWPQQQKTEEKMRELENSINKGLWPAAPGTKDI